MFRLRGASSAWVRIGSCLVLAGPVIACQKGGLGPGPPVGATTTIPSDRITLRLDRDGALILDGDKFAREDLARAFAQLAERVRHDAKAKGIPIDPGGSLPSTIVIEADDETPCSKVLSLGSDWQASGFQRFVLESSHPESTPARHAETVRAQSGVSSRDPIPDRPRPERSKTALYLPSRRRAASPATCGPSRSPSSPMIEGRSVPCRSGRFRAKASKPSRRRSPRSSMTPIFPSIRPTSAWIPSSIIRSEARRRVAGRPECDEDLLRPGRVGKRR